MAAPKIPINTFKLVLVPLTTPGNVVYSAPTNVSSIILSLHIANTSTSDEFVSVKLQSGSVTMTLLSGSIVPAGETMIPFSSRVVLEQTNGLIISSSNSGVLETSISVLENANT